MTSVCVAIPVLGRPEQVAAVNESLVASRRDVVCWPLYMLSPRRADDLAAVRETEEDFVVVDWSPEEVGDYQRKVNLAFEASDSDWILMAASDVRFEQGWAEEALAVSERTGARVIGTNDLGNPAVRMGRHATHIIFRRDYVTELGTVDEPGKVLCESYRHWFCDNEAVETAKWRGEWAFARRSVVEHLHPLWGKGERDWVYDLGESRMREDAELFRSRRPLWGAGRRAGLARRSRMR